MITEYDGLGGTKVNEVDVVARCCGLGRYALGVALAIGCSTAADPPRAPDAGVTCGALEIHTPEGCRAVGVPGDQCGDGFRSDGEAGCAPVLPSTCGTGELAIPGDSKCHAPECSGDPPAGALHVSASAAAGGDGTAARPFKTIQEAIARASAGATIAVAPGQYNEDLVLSRAITLAGRCAPTVEVRGLGAQYAIEVRAAAELRGISVTGPGGGIRVSRASGARLRSLRVHDTAGQNAIVGELSSALSLDEVLIERGALNGLVLVDTSATVTRSAMRGTPNAVLSDVSFSDAFHDLVLTRSTIETAKSDGVLVSRNQARIEGCAFRDLDSGISANNSDGKPGTVTVVGSTFERLAGAAIRANAVTLSLERVTVRQARNGAFLTNTTATLDACIIRDAPPPSPGGPIAAWGILTGSLTKPLPTTITNTVIMRMGLAGIFVAGSDATIRSTLVRETRPREVDGAYGDGIAVSATNDFAGMVAIEQSASVGNARAGVALFGAAAKLTGVTLQCNSVDLGLNGKYYEGTVKKERAFSLEDLGGNICGCKASAACRGEPSDLEPIRLDK